MFLDNLSIVRFIFILKNELSRLTYREGRAGRGPGADNSWAGVIIATMSLLQSSTMHSNLRTRSTGYLLAGVPHTFTMQISKTDGLQTLDNIHDNAMWNNLDNIGKIVLQPSYW